MSCGVFKNICAENVLQVIIRASVVKFIFSGVTCFQRILLNIFRVTCFQHINSIVYEVIRRISSLLIFFYEKILNVKKAPKRKQTTFTLSEVSVRAKNFCLYCLVFACFCFVHLFMLVTYFCLFKIFSLKKNR